MYNTIDMYDTVHATVLDTVHTYGMMTWHWPMMWHWLMRCYDSVGLNFLGTVDRWRGSILVDQKSRIRYMHIHRIIFNQTASLFKPRHYSNRVTIQTAWSNRVTIQTAWSNRVLLTDDVAQSWASEMFLIQWPWFTQYIYKKGALPP